MVPVLEAVPNFSEGRDLAWVREVVRVIAAAGADVLDWSADPHHHRSVVTFVGTPPEVEEAAVAAACFARDTLDLTHHEGLHPRVGALDVLPFVPLLGLSRDEAVAAARRVAVRLADEGIPVYLYGWASDPPGRTLASLRRGGFEALRGGFPEGRAPDLPAAGAPEAPHPTAGVTCVGARDVLLAWNVALRGIELERARALAASLREAGGGFASLRALAFELPGTGLVQISMNLEAPEHVSPMDVFRAIEQAVADEGGEIAHTEVIGLVPDALVLTATADRLQLLDPAPSRLLSRRLAEHVSARGRPPSPAGPHRDDDG